MFVALELPEGARSAIASWRDELTRDREDLRRVEAGKLHMTLVFLGWQAEDDAERIAAAAFGAASGLTAPRLAAGDVRPLPPRRPRLFALDLVDEGGRASALQGAVSGALESGRFHRPEKRPFWPHVTLARVKRGARAEPLPDVPGPAEPFEARELTLYRSTLRPQGALYEPLAEAVLDA